MNVKFLYCTDAQKSASRRDAVITCSRRGNKQTRNKRVVCFAWQSLLSLLHATAEGKDQSPEDFSEDSLMIFGILT